MSATHWSTLEWKQKEHPDDSSFVFITREECQIAMIARRPNRPVMREEHSKVGVESRREADAEGSGKVIGGV